MSRVTEFFNQIAAMRPAEFGWSDVAEVIILAILIYHIMLWIKTTRAWTLVKGFSLTLRKGEFYAILGGNGAGKTTAIKMLSCLTSPTEGDAFVCGHSIVKNPGQVKRLIGVSPQETAVAPNLSVEENLELICGIHRFSKEKTKRRIEERVNGMADAIIKRLALPLEE